MKSKPQKQVVPEAILKAWWWRRLVFVEFDQETHTTQWKRFVPEFPEHGFSLEWNRWHIKDELVAFRYEVLRRIFFPHLPEYPSLQIWQLPRILGVIAPKPERSVCGIFYPTSPEHYASLGDWMWDLTASDESLSKHFLSRINEERKRQNLPCTNDPFDKISDTNKKVKKRRGERNRQVSWLAVEAFDIQKHKIRLLTDGERSRLSKAKREVSMFENKMIEALKHLEDLFPRSDKNTELNIYHRFLKENYQQRIASRLKRE